METPTFGLNKNGPMIRNYIAFSEIAESDKTYIVALTSILKNSHYTRYDKSSHWHDMCVKIVIEICKYTKGSIKSFTLIKKYQLETIPSQIYHPVIL